MRDLAQSHIEGACETIGDGMREHKLGACETIGDSVRTM